MAKVEYHVKKVGNNSIAGLNLRLRAVDETMSVRVKALLERVGAATKSHLEREIPYGETGDAGHLHLADTVRTSGIHYRPGGAGGGGYYELFIVAGVQGRTPQLGYLLRGTGIYAGRERITAGQGNLGPGMMPQAMPMTGGDIGPDTIFRTSTRGQEAQTEWLTSAQALARSMISRGVSNMGRNL